MKKSISVFMAILMVLSILPIGTVVSSALTSGSYEYDVISQTEKTAQITAYKGQGGDLDIPNTLNGYEIQVIGYNAFKDCETIKSVTVPNGVLLIGDSAFAGCSNVEKVTIGTNTRYIGNRVFKDCPKLKDIIIPDSVNSIGNDAFFNTAWYDLKADGVIYAGKVLYKYKGTMPQNTEIIINQGTNSICDSAFIDCTGLAKITIPNSVIFIDAFAFGGCSTLKEVIIPNSVMRIGNGVFRDCTSLENINVNENNEYYKDVDGVLFYTLGNNIAEIIAFPGGKTGSYSIPSGVTSVFSEAFRGATSLTSVTIPNGVTSIGYNVFRGCTALAEVKLPASVTEIGTAAFYDCASLRSISLPDKLTDIGSSAFSGCTSLTSISIPNKVNRINFNTFDGCTALTRVTIGEKVSVIGDKAFFNCPNLKKITIPDTVTKIDSKALGYFSDNNNEVKVENFTIVASKDSAGEKYAINNGFVVGEPGKYQLGDVTCDGMVDSADAILILRYEAMLMALSDEQKELADVTKDGNIDSADAIKIARYDAQLIPNL